MVGIYLSLYAKSNQGRVATFRVYSRELTQNEISQNYNAQKRRFGL